MSNRVDISNLLTEMRALKAQTNAFQKPEALNEINRPARPGEVSSSTKVPGFSEVMSNAVSKVNELQNQAGSMAESYQRGDANVDITDVMIASQKASVSFEAAVQVRNKLVEAYRDIMNMPI